MTLVSMAAGCFSSSAGRATYSLPPYDLPDGVYAGRDSAEMMGGDVAATVELTLSAGRITRVEVIDGRSLTAGTDSIIPARIVQYQTPVVEAVTGATASAEIIMRAARAALIEARKKREKR